MVRCVEYHTVLSAIGEVVGLVVIDVGLVAIDVGLVVIDFRLNLSI